MRIVVIGGGIAGLSIGWRLAQSGCQTVVLERALPGRAATWAAGGMLAAGAETASAPSADTALAERSAAMWPAFARELEEQAASPVHYSRCGSLIVATSAAERQALSQHVPAGASLMEPADVRARAPELGEPISGAVWAPQDAQVDNRALGMALARAFANAGGSLKVNEAVVRLEFEGEKVVGARTPFGLYEADAFVLAAGAWSGELKGVPPDVLPPVIPVKGEMIALSPPSGVRLPVELIWGNGVYLIPRHDCLFVGATVDRVGFDTATTKAAREFLVSRALALMPSLVRWTLKDQWAGLRPGSPDDLPIVGATALANLYVASGQFRNGILFAPAIAETLNALVTGQKAFPEFEAFRPTRFAAGALAGGKSVR